jgi:phosphatidate cytidylyltransferase
VLRWRLFIGAFLIAGIAGLCALDVRASRPGTFLAPLAVVAAGLAAGEMLRMFTKRGVQPVPWTVYIGVLLPVAASAAAVIFSDFYTVKMLGRIGVLGLALSAALLLALVGEMLRYKAPGESISNVAHAALAILYVGGLVGMLVQLRLVGGSVADVDPEKSALTLLPLASLIAIVKLSDIGQYTFGRLFGRNKLAPLISPGKTWEGAIGGIGAAVALAAFGLPILDRGLEGVRAWQVAIDAAFALSLALAGIAGDLAESLLKRDAGVKDSSDWLPGFGGVLDLLDSLMFASPVAYAWWASPYL